MKTILLLHDESGSPEPRLQNVAGSKVTQRPSEAMPGCNCDRWGHPLRTVSNTMQQGIRWKKQSLSGELATRGKARFV